MPLCPGSMTMTLEFGDADDGADGAEVTGGRDSTADPGLRTGTAPPAAGERPGPSQVDKASTLTGISTLLGAATTKFSFADSPRNSRLRLSESPPERTPRKAIGMPGLYLPAMSSVDYRLLPEIREALAAAPFPPIDESNLHQMRVGRYSTIDPALLSDQVSSTTVQATGSAGGPDVALRVHRPVHADEPLPCLYWMHGGGMIMGNANQDDIRFGNWCARHQIMAISVEYRLAPENPYPAPMEDCYAGLVWVQTNAAELGVDPARIGIGGASAGGGLAAGLALLARDRGLPGPTLASQLLIYPMIDDRQTTPSSSWDVPIWPPASNRFGWGSYLGPLVDGNVPIYAAPARATSLAGLPPALVIVGALDGFLDEDVDYALRLNRAGVDVELHVYPGAPHGFDGLLPGTAVAKKASRDIHEWLANHYAH